ncbi:MAG: S9 family peptidase [Chloroflexota bacterium]|nr:S9 family peptidase [Chloroflexota bacterium]
MLDLAQLLRVPQVHPQFDISPDDSKLAFSWNETGEWQIHEMAFTSPFGRGVRGEGNIQQLTSGIGGKFNPRYSPNGTYLAYALDMDGSESYHLVLLDLSTNIYTDLTPNISHALQPNFCWSPDGQQLAFLSDEHGHFSAYVISASGGDAALILDTGHPAWQVEWSPDGKHLAVCCEMHGQDYGIFINDLESREVTMLCHPPEGTSGRCERQRRVSGTVAEILTCTGVRRKCRSTHNDILNAYDPRWSPDGTKLIFHSDLHGWFDISVYDLALREINWLTGSDVDSQSPMFLSKSADQGFLPQIAYTQSQGGVNWIEILDTEGKRKTYQIGRGIHDGIKFTSDLKRMICNFSSPSQPPDLWIVDFEQGTSIQLTNSMSDELSRQEFIEPEEIHYAGMDGVQVPSLLYRQKQTPAPAVVMIHGGPNWHYSAEWNPLAAHLASRGFTLLAPNYRGSTGYGRDWQYAARYDLGGVDTRDVAAGAKYLLYEGLAIDNKIVVTGRSHGGYLTMTCLTQYPELWCAGSAVVPFMNWIKSHADSREDLQHWNIENMGDPIENHQRWYDASPYFFLDQVTAPVQLICGGNDPRCPASDSIEARDKLVELGKDVELLLYEDEGHAFLKIENIIDSELKRVEFLAKALEKN